MDESKHEVLSQNDRNDDTPNKITDELAKKPSPIFMWIVVLSMYVLLLMGMGYIAFFEQDFNNPQHTIGGYIDILDDYKNEAPQAAVLSEDDFSQLLIESMKKDSESAGDLQELASQSFNIILGAILAFLSGSITLIFQRISKRQH